MPAKRKRDILDGFDPNKSDSEDENFEPSADRPTRSKKKSRQSRGKGSGSVKRHNKYRGSDIDDDEELEDSELEEGSFAEDNDDEGDEEEEEEERVNEATGRVIRRAAAKQQSYRESSEDEEASVGDSEKSDGDGNDAPKRKSGRPSRIVVLKTNLKNTKPRRGPDPPLSAGGTRRSTRARTEETEEPLVELSNSGRHVQPARASRSKSPEAVARALRATRGGKGLVKPPPPIEEATQESTSHATKAEDEDELAGDADANPAPEGPSGQDNPEDEDMQHVDVVEDSANEDDVDELAQDKLEDELAGPSAEQVVGDDDDDDDMPITRRTRNSRASISGPAAVPEAEDASDSNAATGRLGRKSRRLQKAKSAQEPSSDFEPGEENESGDDDLGSGKDGNKANDEDSSSTPQRGRRSKRGASKKSRHNEDSDEEEPVLDKDELAEELEELRESSRSRPRRRRVPTPPSPITYESKRRRTQKVDYSIKPLDAAFEADEEEDAAPAAATPARGRRGGRNGGNATWERSLNTAYGPFGGGGGAGSLLNGPWGTGATGGVDSDSSDDEMGQRSGVGGMVGMTPTSAAPPAGLFALPAQTHNIEGLAGLGGGPAPNVGKIKNQKALADADPLGVDMNVDFSKVGGLQGHIDQLKEMVQLPLLYPELFLKFHVTPPRGVLFHGPPGTGKTLLARALANSIGSGGRKITFYMRKGADALSKWVGEAEKQLRLLFEEARRTQPSIIFFDEIDGLAPVRSSKQEQIHASIVSTLLALMDGMDGRGQVIVIGATNRPDNIDPALRRPGRFDREFYFPLPDLTGRKAILNIHTKDWGLSDPFLTRLAESTKGYGGADLRALCTEAALNSIQRTYPQIYSSKEKLIVDPAKINVAATDFMISIKKMIPSSERSASSAAAPLPKSVEPLLRGALKTVVKMLADILPRKKKITALEEAMFEPYADSDQGFGREAMAQEFERLRVYRPRLLVGGRPGMGQHYLSAAILHHLEGVHVQKFDLATLLGDGRPPEQVIVSLFTEVRRHKPSVIFIPSIESWWETVGQATITTFLAMLRSIPPADPVLLLATAECERLSDLPEACQKDLFGYSKKNRAVIDRPSREHRFEYFSPIGTYLKKSPTDFPDPSERKKRVLDVLPVAPPPPPKPPTKAEIKAQRKADLHALNVVKMRLQPIMDQINRKYKKFRQPVIALASIAYLFDEADPNYVRPDIPLERPFEIATDADGTDGLRETATGKFFYNLETTTIEERLANGFYVRPTDFYKDVDRLYKDSKAIGDRERTLKASELRTNVEVDCDEIEQQLKQHINFDDLLQRQKQRTSEKAAKERKRAAMRPLIDLVQSDVHGENDSDSQGPVRLADSIPGPATTAARFAVIHPPSNGHDSSSDSHPLTNGHSAPSRPSDHDVVMGGVDDETQLATGPNALQLPGQWPRMEPQPTTGSTRATAGNTQASQRSAAAIVPPSGSPPQVVPDASTTESNAKTSDGSTNRGSGNWSTQATNGFHQNEESQLVDTQSQTGPGQAPSQSTSNESQWPASQAYAISRGILHPRMGLPAAYGETSPTSSQVPQKSTTTTATSSGSSKSNVASVANILNDDAVGGNLRNSGSSASSSQHQQPVMQEAKISHFVVELADRTSGCTVEQLEQINRDLMEALWSTRGEWNRMTVLAQLVTVFNEDIGEMEETHALAQSSQEMAQVPYMAENVSYMLLR